MTEQKLGRYTLIKRLAMGGMAEIFLAKQEGPAGFDRQVVIKRILPHLSDDPQFVDMFLDEARIAALLTHPNIAQIYDFGEDEGTYFIAMELVRGPDLRRVISAATKAKIRMPPEIVARVTIHACHALEYAHEAVDGNGNPLSVVHRDVSPQNILLGLNGLAKLVDFGIVKASTTHKTSAGNVKGKFAYMSPEQIEGKALDARSDLYGLGLVLYELLCNQRALQGDSDAVLVRAAVDAQVTPIRELVPDLPEELIGIVDKSLKRQRELRYQSAREMGDALEGFLHGRGKAVTAHDIADFLKTLQIESGDALSPVGTGSFPSKVSARAAAVAEKTPTAPSDGGTDEPTRTLSKGSVKAPPRRVPPRAAPRAAAQIAPVEDPELAQETRVGLVSPPVDDSEVEHVDGPTNVRALNRARPGPRAVDAEEVDLGEDDDDLFLAAQRKKKRLLWVGSLAVGTAICAGLFFSNRGTEKETATVEPAGLATAPTANEPEPAKAVTPEAAPSPSAPDTTPTPAIAKEPEPTEPAVADSKPRERHAATGKKGAPKQKLVSKAKPTKVAALEPKAPEGEGYLSVGTNTWAEAYVDGRKVGTTPIWKVGVSAGQHELRLVNAEWGIDRRKTIAVAAGEEHKEVVKFAKGKVSFRVLPWAEVRLGKKLLGQTPMPPQDLFEGTYTLTFSNPETGKSETRTVTVEAGAEQMVKVDLRK